MGSRPAGVAAARGHRRRHRRAVVRDARRAPRPRRPRRRAARNRRYAVARRLAGLFASYAVQRPAAGRRLARRAATPTAPGASSTPTCTGRPSCGAAWSAGSARRLPTCATPTTMAALRAGGDDLDLPPRLSLFGHTRLPETEVQLLRALGELRDVHLWLPQASPVLVGRAGADRPRRAGAARRGPVGRRGRPSAARLAGPRRARAAAHTRRRSPGVDAEARRDADAGHPARLAAARPARQRRARRGTPGPPGATSDDVGAGARLPRRGPSGRRAARGAGRPARRTTRRWSRATSS